MSKDIFQKEPKHITYTANSRSQAVPQAQAQAVPQADTAQQPTISQRTPEESISAPTPQHSGTGAQDAQPTPVRRIVYSQGNAAEGGGRSGADLPPDYFVDRKFSYNENLKPAGQTNPTAWVGKAAMALIFGGVGLFIFFGAARVFSSDPMQSVSWVMEPGGVPGGFTGGFPEDFPGGTMTFSSEEELDEWLAENGNQFEGSEQENPEALEPQLLLDLALVVPGEQYGVAELKMLQESAPLRHFRFDYLMNVLNDTDSTKKLDQDAMVAALESGLLDTVPDFYGIASYLVDLPSTQFGDVNEALELLESGVLEYEVSAEDYQVLVDAELVSPEGEAGVLGSGTQEVRAWDALATEMLKTLLVNEGYLQNSDQ